MTEEKFLLKNPQETKKLGASLAQKLRDKPALVFLSGDLSAGKTTFAQGLIGELLKSASTVQSPTYAYMQIYQGNIPIYHFDLYRVEDAQSIFELGLYEHLCDDHALRIVEWPERLPKNLMKPHILIALSQKGAGRLAIIKNFINF